MKIYVTKSKFDEAINSRIKLKSKAYYKVVTWGGNMHYAQNATHLLVFYPSGDKHAFPLSTINEMSDSFCFQSIFKKSNLAPQDVPKRKEKYYLFRDAEEFSRYLTLSDCEVPEIV